MVGASLPKKDTNIEPPVLVLIIGTPKMAPLILGRLQMEVT